MDCHDARQQLAAGLRPGSRPPERAVLGFHLAGCAGCRATLEALSPPDDTLLQALLANHARTVAAKTTVATRTSRRMTRRWIVAIMVGLLLASVGFGGRWWWGKQAAVASIVVLPTVDSEADVPSVIAQKTATIQPAGAIGAVPINSIAATHSNPIAVPIASTATQPPQFGLVPQASPTPSSVPSATPAPLPENAVTILLLGLDRRPGESETSRSDAMLLLHLDPISNTAALLSFARDLWVPLGGVGEYVKINAGYTYGEGAGGPAGGAQSARDTVQALVNQPIDHVVVITFEGLIKTVDALGGIELEVETEIYDPEYPTFDYGYMVAHFLPGRQTMDGFTALVYSRTRHADNDFARGRRQQQVLLAIAAKLRQRLTDGDMLAQMALVNELYNDLEYTDLPLTEAVRFGRVISEIEPANMRRASVDLEYGYATTTLDGAYIIEPNLPAIQQLAADLFER